ncbi:MAG TPA: glycosyltransferase, partial [Thermoanaerobaculia bacterium]
RAETIRVWIATDGAGQQGVASSEAATYAERRREEARRAARALGLESPAFGPFADRELARRMGDLESALSAVIEETRPDLILCPSPVEIHPDHRALAEALYTCVASSRPGDADHDRFRFLRLAFYEISHPLLPNALVDITETERRKRDALGAYETQQAVRDYAGALAGLNAYRRLTLGRGGPVEAFRVADYVEVSTRSLEEFRRSIGPSVVSDGERGPVPVGVVLRTRNRPALLREALESLAQQTARPAQVVVVNDGGAPVGEMVSPFRSAFAVLLEESPQRRGRSAAANAGARAAAPELLAFLDDDDRYYPDHLERLVRAHRSGPEPVVYSDAVTVVYRREAEEWVPRGRSLQYSLDFDPDYLLLANYIPLHTALMPRLLYSSSGGFDERLEYSEDWDFFIRLSERTSFRHVRAVTCEYRVFESSEGDPGHEPSGGVAFQKARRIIYERYASRRSEEGLARVLDRLRRQIAFWYERDTTSQGELRYQRESHRLLHARLAQAEALASAASSRAERAEEERALVSTERDRAEARAGELVASVREQERLLTATQAEIDRLNSILH